MRKGAALVAVATVLALAGQAQAMRLGKPVAPCWLLAHQPLDPGAQTITVVNQANVRPANLCRVELAVQDQALQLRAAWGTPPIAYGARGWNVYLKTGRDLGGPWGFHANPTVGAAPYAVIWTAGLAYLGWSGDFSHELMEMLADPYQDTYAGSGHIGPYDPALPDDQLVEVCDPLAGQGYYLDGVIVAQFEPPSYYGAY